MNHFLQGVLVCECLNTNKKNLAVSKKHKVFNWIRALKKEKNSFRNDLLHSYKRIFKWVSEFGPIAIHFFF